MIKGKNFDGIKKNKLILFCANFLSWIGFKLVFTVDDYTRVVEDYEIISTIEWNKRIQFKK